MHFYLQSSFLRDPILKSLPLTYSLTSSLKKASKYKDTLWAEVWKTGCLYLRARTISTTVLIWFILTPMPTLPKQEKQVCEGMDTHTPAHLRLRISPSGATAGQLYWHLAVLCTNMSRVSCASRNTTTWVQLWESSSTWGCWAPYPRSTLSGIKVSKQCIKVSAASPMGQMSCLKAFMAAWVHLK